MTFAIELNFTNKCERSISLNEIEQSRANGNYCWIDLRDKPESELREFLASMGVDAAPIDAIVRRDTIPAFAIHTSCLYFTLSEARAVDGEFEKGSVDVVLGDGFMITIHQGDVEFLTRAHQTYREAFYTAALSPGYLLFELTAHLVHVCGETLARFSEQIEEIESELFGDTDDDIFLPVSELIRSLLKYRKTVIASREVVYELATRRSPFVAKTTQPFLEKKAELLDRLSADATTEREVLSEFLTLYMGIISHRTNHVITRLTIISAIFLPLAFVTGLYGMNFDTNSPWNMPELQHDFGYVGFWAISATIVVGMLIWMRHKKWL